MGMVPGLCQVWCSINCNVPMDWCLLICNHLVNNMECCQYNSLHHISHNYMHRCLVPIILRHKACKCLVLSILLRKWWVDLMQTSACLTWVIQEQDQCCNMEDQDNDILTKAMSSIIWGWIMDGHGLGPSTCPLKKLRTLQGCSKLPHTSMTHILTITTIKLV